jgi:hypothetical protein
MNHRVITTFLVLAVIATVLALCVRGCTPTAVNARYDCSFLINPNLTPAEKKVAWQKMKKWRSVHNAWFENDPTPWDSLTTTDAEQTSASNRCEPRLEALGDANLPAK